MSHSVPLYIGEIDAVPMDFDFDFNNVTFETINLNRGFALFLGTVCQLTVSMILSSYYLISV